MANPHAVNDTSYPWSYYCCFPQNVKRVSFMQPHLVHSALLLSRRDCLGIPVVKSMTPKSVLHSLAQCALLYSFHHCCVFTQKHMVKLNFTCLILFCICAFFMKTPLKTAFVDTLKKGAYRIMQSSDYKPSYQMQHGPCFMVQKIHWP